MKITKREIIASVSMIALMFILGIIISGKISENIIDSNEKYNKAVRIEDEELFKYGMSTNVGDAFVYGDLKVTDTVTYPEIGGEYSYIRKIKEEYTMHTRIVAYTDSEGKTETKEETYWTWDEVHRENLKSQKAVFLRTEFEFSKFENLKNNYIDTIYEYSDTRYQYYGSPIEAKGTIFTSLQDNNIGKDIKVYEDMSIEQTYEYLESGSFLIFLFWGIWVLLTFASVYVFYYLDNEWLNR